MFIAVNMTGPAAVVFIVLHCMQRGISDRKVVHPVVCPSVAKRSRANIPLMRNEEIPNSQSQTTYFDLLKLEFNVDINVT